MSTSSPFPLAVMIIRHGEKPGDPSNDSDGGPNLSILGSARAAALPSLFTPDPTQTSGPSLPQLTCDLLAGFEGEFGGKYGSSNVNARESQFFTPDFLFATEPTNSSSRPVETITPTAQALQFFKNDPGLTINANFTNDTNGITALTSEILGNPNTYGGKYVLICWHHGTIPELTEAFKVPPSQLPWTKWPSTVFDLIFFITWPSGQPQLKVGTQRLLYGDSATAPGQSS
ncbi:MAG TPA: hypothetical protein VFY60_12355 [Pyrinomonadaceae bacterium]|nr:hypothetical protein [Pyrinomonadaceae bacterium]